MHLRPPFRHGIYESIPGRQLRIAVDNSGILGKRALTRIDDDQGSPFELGCVKTARPRLITARSRKPWNMTMTRMKGVDAAMADWKFLPHLEMGVKVRPHRGLVSVAQRDHEIERLDVADKLQRPQQRIASEDGHDVVEVGDVVRAGDESLLAR